MDSHLFIPPNRPSVLLEKISSGDATAVAMVDALQNADCVFKPDWDGPLHELCIAWLHGNQEAAEKAGEDLLAQAIPESNTEKSKDSVTSDLGKGAGCFTLALAWDFGKTLWSESLRKRWVDHIVKMAHSITQVNNGNPHIITNNWYMITHGGCLIACLAMHGETGTAGPVDVSDLERWALGRFKAFLNHFGNEGLYHEGTGYIAYTLSILMPALVALRNRRGLDLTLEFPNLRSSIRSMLMGTALLPARANGTPASHTMLDWNDTGREAARLNPLIPGLIMSHPEDQPGLLDFFNRTRGVQGINNWLCSYRGLPLSLALYPFDLEPVDAESVLPRHLLDTRQGMGIWRDHWGDGTETVLGWYSRSTHASPGHAHDDAASIRLMANGRSWICGAGQARIKSKWQSVLTHADESERPNPFPNAFPFTADMQDVSGWVGIETRQSLGMYSERYLSWRTDLGYPVAMALLDLVDEHKDPIRPLTWNLSFPHDLEASIDEDGKGFTLTDTEAGTLYARFLLDLPTTLQVQQMPGTQRTYASGNTETYPGESYIEARFDNHAMRTILVSIVVCPRGQPAPEMYWKEPSIQLNSETVWNSPFQGAILDTVKLGEHRPNLQRFPAGTPKASS